MRPAVTTRVATLLIPARPPTCAARPAPIRTT